MFTIKALTKVFENWGEDEEDFFVSYQVDIGLSEIDFGSDMFSFDVVSPKRLSSIIESLGSQFGHGFIIMNDFQQSNVHELITKLVEECRDMTEQESYQSLAKYLRWELETFQPKI